ncbi:DNA cytosine methyltransferase [Spiroplasma ixodetis]|uniref:DNA (cytosine-5-)-methyltransferase n=1 Tax=Spiroplasma ixodetis TaxID=2141 RepID=A0ABM8JQZ6_9MOLU
MFIINWLKKYDNLNWIKNSSHKKFEWQAGDNINSIWEGIIQFRPSGVRVKKSDVLSTLVAMNHPQIIGKYKRYITPDEIKSFQRFPKDFKLIDNDNISRKQLGNTITITVAKIILKGLLKFYDENRTSD